MEENQQSLPTPPPVENHPTQRPPVASFLLQKVLIIVFIVIIGVVSIVSGFVMYKNSFGRQSSPTPTPSVSPTPTSNPTENWKTFTNEKYGFTFMYPPRLELSPKFPYGVLMPGLSKFEEIPGVADPNTYHQVPEYYIENVDTGTRYDGVNIIIIDIPGKTLDEFVKEYVKTTSFKAGSRNFTPTVSKFTTNGNDVLYIKGGDNSPVSFYVFPLKTDKVLILNRMEASPGSFDEEFDQILSTFKFTDSIIPTCIPRPACLDSVPRCLVPETPDMCPPATITPQQIACTQEAKQCPDGSWVGRSGPNCEFVCP